MATAVKMKSEVNRFIKSQETYIHEVTLPESGFTGGTLAFSDRDITVFGVIKEQAYSMIQAPWDRNVTKLRSRMVRKNLIAGLDYSQNILVEGIDLINVWIEGNKLKVELLNDYDRTIGMCKEFDFEVHK